MGDATVGWITAIIVDPRSCNNPDVVAVGSIDPSGADAAA
jgi:hypothetical protein